MADNKQVRLGVDASEYESNLQRIKASADTLARDLIQSARAYSSSSKEVLADIEDQIRAIERRNKLDSEFRRRELEEKRDRGQISDLAFDRGLQKIEFESKEDKTQTALLREVIQSIRDTAKEQLREDRSSVERQISASRTVSELSPEGDEFSNLIETLQKGELSRIRKDEKEEEFYSGAQRSLTQLGSSITGSSNVYEAAGRAGQMGAGRIAGMGGLAGAAGALALIGVGAAMRAVQASVPYELALAGGFAQTGFGQEGFGRGMSYYGYTMDQTIQERQAISSARGRSLGSGSAAINSLLMQRGFGVDQGTIMALETVLRGDVGGGSARDYTQEAIRGMRTVGMMRGGDLSLLPEYMQTLIQVSQEQLNTLGEIDMGMNIKMVSAISNLDDTFKNPQVLGNVVASLRSGLQRAGTPQQQALQYSVLSRLGGGNLSMFEMEEMRADPFGAKSQEYMPAYLESLKHMSAGNEDMFFFNIMEQFGVSAPMARRIGEGFSAGKLSEILSSDGFIGGDIDLEGRAGGATGTLMRATAQWTNSFMTVGKDLTGVLSELKTSVEKIGEVIAENNRRQIETAEALDTLANALIEDAKDGNILQRFSAWLQASTYREAAAQSRGYRPKW